MSFLALKKFQSHSPLMGKKEKRKEKTTSNPSVLSTLQVYENVSIHSATQ